MNIRNYIFGLPIDSQYCLLATKYKIVIYKNKIHSIKNSPLSFDELSYRMAQNFGFNKDETINLSYHFIAELLLDEKVLIRPERKEDYDAYWNNQLSFNELFLTQQFGV